PPRSPRWRARTTSLYPCFPREPTFPLADARPTADAIRVANPLPARVRCCRLAADRDKSVHYPRKTPSAKAGRRPRLLDSNAGREFAPNTQESGRKLGDGSCLLHFV